MHFSTQKILMISSYIQDKAQQAKSILRGATWAIIKGYVIRGEFKNNNKTD